MDDVEALGIALKRVVSPAGREAIEALARQLAAVVNGAEPEAVRQMALRVLNAFNVEG
jgi:hypothetical protein